MQRDRREREAELSEQECHLEGLYHLLGINLREQNAVVAKKFFEKSRSSADSEYYLSRIDTEKDAVNQYTQFERETGEKQCGSVCFHSISFF